MLSQFIVITLTSKGREQFVQLFIVGEFTQQIHFSQQVFFLKVMTAVFLSRLLVKLQELNYNLKVKVSFDK